MKKGFFLLAIIVLMFINSLFVSADEISIIEGSFVDSSVLDSAFEEESVEKIDVTITPDSPLYGFKRFAEDISLAFTFNSQKRAEKYVSYADERIREMEMMIEKGNIKGLERAKNAYNKILQSIKRHVSLVKKIVDSDDKLESLILIEKKIVAQDERIYDLKELIDGSGFSDKEEFRNLLADVKSNLIAVKSDLTADTDETIVRMAQSGSFDVDYSVKKVEATLGFTEEAATESIEKAKLAIEAVRIKIDKTNDLICFSDCLETTSGEDCVDKCLTSSYSYNVKSDLTLSNLLTGKVVLNDSEVVYSDCKIIYRQPTRDKYWERLGLDTSAHPEIRKYRIQWFSGGWSKWYFTGVDDVDWKTNYDGSVRRVWSYFTDHNHEFETCIGSNISEQVIEEPVIVVEPVLANYSETVIEFNETNTSSPEPVINDTPVEIPSELVVEPVVVDKGRVFKLTFDDTLISTDGESPIRVVGVPKFSNDAISGKSLSAVDSNEYFEYLCEGNFNPEEGSVQAWIKFDNFGRDAVIWHTDDSKYVMYYDRGFTNGYKAIKGRAGQFSPEPTYKFDQRDTPVDEPNTWENSGWHLITMTWDGFPQGIAKLIVDGKLEDVQTYSQGEDCYTFRIGNNYWPGLSWTDGKIDELEMYNYALPPGQALQTYKEFADVIEDSCPNIMPPAPSFCANGTIKSVKKNGCVVSFDCEDKKDTTPELDSVRESIEDDYNTIIDLIVDNTITINSTCLPVSPPQGFCNNGFVVTKEDVDGCTIGFVCEKQGSIKKEDLSGLRTNIGRAERFLTFASNLLEDSRQAFAELNYQESIELSKDAFKSAKKAMEIFS